MPDNLFETPLLINIYNRTDHLDGIFGVLRVLKPTKIYISSDGAKTPADENKVRVARATVENLINWPCSVKYKYNKTNLGCGKSINEAIDWFFGFEEQGIILEDDIFYSLDFFYFTQIMLEKYKYNSRVFMVSGTNYFSKPDKLKPYFFSNYYSIWGFGTWKRAWEKNVHNLNIRTNEDHRIVLLNLSRSPMKYFWPFVFEQVENTKVDTWDYSWVFTCILHNAFSIVPNVNLVSNQGVIGTHSNRKTVSHNMRVLDYDFSSLIGFEPQDIRTNKLYEFNIWLKYFSWITFRLWASIRISRLALLINTKGKN
jgi:hypothetical protein